MRLTVEDDNVLMRVLDARRSVALCGLERLSALDARRLVALVAATGKAADVLDSLQQAQAVDAGLTVSDLDDLVSELVQVAGQCLGWAMQLREGDEHLR